MTSAVAAEVGLDLDLLKLKLLHVQRSMTPSYFLCSTTYAALGVVNWIHAILILYCMAEANEYVPAIRMCMYALKQCLDTDTTRHTCFDSIN